jgi:spermidine synthase
MSPSDTCDLSPSSMAPRRFWLGVLVAGWGIQAIVTQSLLLREALVLMFGSELAWGVVLSTWLLGVAVGAWLGGRAAGSILRGPRAEVGLIIVLLVLGVAGCLELWAFRGARSWLGVGPGEFLPLPRTALAAMLFVSPVGALVGMAFPLACCIGGSQGLSEAQFSAVAERPHGLKPAVGGILSFGQVYGLESAGSLIGGALFSFWAVEHLSPIQTILVCTVVTTAAASVWLAIPPRRPYGALPLAVIALAALLVAVFAGRTLDRGLIHRRWENVAPGYELVAEAESKYQNLAVGKRAGQFTLYCDGHVSADFPDPYTYGPPAHFWMCQHPAPRRVLVLGGGAEGLLAELLLHPVEHIDYVEPDPRQIELIEPFLAEVDRRALADPRVTVHAVDARYYVKTQRDRFDLVIARLPEPTSALRARLYTVEFFGELRQTMTQRSVLCTTAKAAPGELSSLSGAYLASLRQTIGRHFSHITIGWGDPAQVLAATEEGLVSTDPAELADRYTRRGVQSELFDPLWFAGATDWLEPDKLARREVELEGMSEVQVSTDLRPIVYLQRLALWEKMTGGFDNAGSRVIELLRSVSLADLVIVLMAVGGITLAYCRLRHREAAGWTSGTIVLSVGTTGFATMALSIIWLFAFQNLYGYVYQRIGWIIAVFMGGLVIGCALAGRRSKRVGESAAHRAFLWRWLCIVDVLLAQLAILVPFLLPALGALQAGPLALVLVEWCVLIMVALTGVLGGAAFVLAGGLQLEMTGRAGAAAGTVVGADHAGACLGALLSGILLVPVFGTATAALLLAGVKLASAALLVVGWKLSRGAPPRA